ncbi:MAG TPA: heparinase II/III family protein [Gemmatimonadaceae bacterium]|nr:heparinase II/III family protein [Gemmatimonadaceae bacterium]
MLLLPDHRLAGRRAVAAGGLAPLADSLARDLEPLIGREPYVPAEKARLTRVGGRCPRDGALLEFDPFERTRHRCPQCGEWYADPAHDRFWIMWYQLWLAERAVHGALLHLLRGDTRHAALADSILEAYSARYLEYPNVDNVLGPTRPFFSTYLESIWLLQLCVALDLREASEHPPPAALGARVRERIIAPSAALVASYDEGASNRQVWNDAALLAASRLLGDADAAERALYGPSGTVSHLRSSLLADGTWYEGENYHLFAHRGLWYGVTMAETAGAELPPSLVRRFEEGFATPFVSALPDLTFPSRRDSQYGVSLRQWRFAELCELGLVRRDDGRLLGALGALYDPALPAGRPLERARSTAEAERNVPASRLTRAELGWRSLLAARETLPPLPEWTPRSALLEAQGLAVIRRDGGRVYAALDYGHSGGGHGHPDRLNLLLVDGTLRWLDDVGTGSYVDPTLHWYRSTLAHNAPLVDGRSQARVHGVLRAFEDRGAAGWVDADVHGIAPGVVARRTVVVMPDYLVDELAWDAGAREVTLDLPVHADGELSNVGPWTARDPGGGGGTEDGFDFLREARAAEPLGVDPVRLAARLGQARADVWLSGTALAQCWSAVAPGAPGRGERRFHFFRSRGGSGVLTSVWSWRGAVQRMSHDDGRLAVELADGSRHLHARAGRGWHIELHAGGARSSIDLGGACDDVGAGAPEPDEAAGARRSDRESPPSPASPASRAPLVIPTCPAGRGAPPEKQFTADPSAPRHPAEPGGVMLRLALGEPHYRRSEQSWAEAGSPTAEVALAACDGQLRVRVHVRKAEPTFAARRESNELDNEHPDTNSDGVQLYVSLSRGSVGDGGAWLLVPEPGGDRVRSSPIGGGGAVPMRARWAPALDGYVIECAVNLPASTGGETRGALEVIVNEIAPGRERRRGQLVLSGAAGEWTYLRGDRHDPERSLPFVIGNG